MPKGSINHSHTLHGTAIFAHQLGQWGGRINVSPCRCGRKRVCSAVSRCFSVFSCFVAVFQSSFHLIRSPSEHGPFLSRPVQHGPGRSRSPRRCAARSSRPRPPEMDRRRGAGAVEDGCQQEKRSVRWLEKTSVYQFVPQKMGIYSYNIIY